MDIVETKVNFYDAIVIEWHSADGQFGHIYVSTNDEGNAVIDSEYMSREFVKKVLCNLVDTAILK